MQTLGETREAMSRGLMKQIEDFASNMKHMKEPFYIVFHAKADHIAGNCIRQSIKAYSRVPKDLLGILVWYVDNKTGTFEFKPELSSPPDVPIDPRLLSDNPQDFNQRVAERGQKLNVLVS
jgi:hypothetical protein